MNQPPTGQPPYPPAQGGYGLPTGMPPPPPPPENFQPEKPMSGMAIASFITSLVGGLLTGVSVLLPCCVVFAPAVLVGLVLGFIAMFQTKPSGTRRGMGFAIAGIAIAVLSIIGGVVAVVSLGVYFNDINNQVQESERANVNAGMELVRDRLQQYATENDGLGPGGPVLAQPTLVNDHGRITPAANGATTEEPTGRVNGQLQLRHLVHEDEFHGTMSLYRLRVTGQNTAVVEYRDWNNTPVATMTITDAKRGLSNIVFHDD